LSVREDRQDARDGIADGGAIDSGLEGAIESAFEDGEDARVILSWAMLVASDIAIGRGESISRHFTAA
jgi:hypothetical protein